MRRVAVLLSLVVIGCGGKRLYDGPARPTSEVAHLRVNEFGSDYEVGVASCDGRSAGWVGTEFVEILPGQHTCRVICKFAGRETDFFEITFTASPGRVYRMEGERGMGRSCVVKAADIGPIGGG